MSEEKPKSEEKEELITDNRGYWGYRELTNKELKSVSGAGCGCGSCGVGCGIGCGVGEADPGPAEADPGPAPEAPAPEAPAPQAPGPEWGIGVIDPNAPFDMQNMIEKGTVDTPAKGDINLSAGGEINPNTDPNMPNFPAPSPDTDPNMPNFPAPFENPPSLPSI
jgi:hypothetical protein